MSTALIAKFIREAGAEIARCEPPGGDPFYDIYPAYAAWHDQGVGKCPAKDTADELQRWLADADICVIGGEDYPGLDWQFDASELLKLNSRLIVVEVTASPPIEGEDPPASHELLAQARSGMSFENFSDRPIAFNFPVATYGAVLNAITGVFVALISREQTGQGQIVSTSLIEGALDACRSMWYQAEQPDPLFMAMVPKDSRMTIFRCNDGKYVHMMMGTPGAKERFYQLIGLDPNEFTDTLNDRGMPTGRGEPSMFWGDIEAFAKPISKFSSDEFVRLLNDNGFPGIQVYEPGECWDMPQIGVNGILKTDSSGRQHVGFPINGL